MPTAAWAVGLVAGLAGLTGLAILVGRPKPASTTGALDAIQATLRQPKPAVALTVILLAWIAFCFRRIWLEYLATAPGHIGVETFAAGSNVSETEAERLTLAFRHRLGELHLDAPKSAPGQASGADFLDVLDQGGVDSGNWLHSALSLARAAKPRHAWEVRGVLVEGDEAPRYGLAVQVVRAPGESNPPETIWGDSWDEAVRLGADYATAAILPRTRRCVDQWAAWRHYRMHGRLVGHYEDAVDFEASRQYDKALDAYYRAADHDPMNMALRLRIGLLQERMGLYLDAVATYQGIIKVAKERNRFWRTLEPRKARTVRRRSAIVARYRRMVLLGGSEFAKQWRRRSAREGVEPHRDARRQRLRERLTMPLRDLTIPVSSKRRRLGRTDARDLLAAYPVGPDVERDELGLELRELLALAVLRDRWRLYLRLLVQVRDRKLFLSSQSVRLTTRCIELRLARVQNLLKPEAARAWPPSLKRLKWALRWIQLNAQFNRWHEYYNAACVYALPLLAPLDGDTKFEFAKKAVHRLEQATTSADSAYLAGQRDWLLSEDPDLDGLRTHWLFKDFEAMYFPRRDATPPRPRHVKTLESSRYVRALLESTALSWENAWHRRSQDVGSDHDVHELLAWWNDECDAWSLVREVARNNRHWPTRVALLKDLEEHAHEYALAPAAVRFPHYADEPLARDESGKPPDAGDVARKWERHFHRIGETLPGPEAKQRHRREIAEIGRWQATLRQLDTRGREPRRFLLALLCDEHAALWQLFREWVVADPEECVGEGARFRRQMKRTARVSRATATWWWRPALVPVVAERSAGPVRIVGRTVRNGHLPAEPSPAQRQ